MARSYFLLFFVLACVPFNSTAQQNFPIIDGVISQGEWVGNESIIRMQDGRDVRMVVLQSEVEIYFLFTFSGQTSSNDVINRDPSTGRHDYFGIEFDNNKDSVIMGNSESPDDMALFDYEKYGAVDMFSNDFTAYYDEDYSGTNDVEGVSGQDDLYFIYELRKPLKSGDENGHDLNITKGESLHLMIAIWDDKPIHTTASTVNVAINDSTFVEIPLTEESNSVLDSVNSSKTNSEVLISGFWFYLSGISIFILVIIKRFTQKN